MKIKMLNYKTKNIFKYFYIHVKYLSLKTMINLVKNYEYK